jgi:putative heme iron utilization protein
MNVAQLVGELAPDVEVMLPEGLRDAQSKFARDRLLERLQGLCQAALFRFAYQ